MVSALIKVKCIYTELLRRVSLLSVWNGSSHRQRHRCLSQASITSASPASKSGTLKLNLLQGSEGTRLSTLPWIMLFQLDLIKTVKSPSPWTPKSSRVDHSLVNLRAETAIQRTSLRGPLAAVAAHLSSPMAPPRLYHPQSSAVIPSVHTILPIWSH